MSEKLDTDYELRCSTSQIEAWRVAAAEAEDRSLGKWIRRQLDLAARPGVKKSQPSPKLAQKRK